MSEPRLPPADVQGDRLPDIGRGLDGAPNLPDGGRREVVVGPGDVWPAPGPAPVIDEPAAARAARRSFFSSIALVVGVSTALMLVAVALILLWVLLG